MFADADLDLAVEGAVRGIFRNQGEVCLAGSRLLVQRRVHDEFVERFVAAAEALRVGDPKDPATQVGPLVEAAHRDKVAATSSSAQAEGGELLTGGAAPTERRSANGCYFAPTVLAGMDNEMRAVARGDLRARCRSSCRSTTRTRRCDRERHPYGLAGMLWTANLDRAHRVAGGVRTGTVWVNCFFDRDLRAPFGGVKASGIGREGGAYSREFFTEPRPS